MPGCSSQPPAGPSLCVLGEPLARHQRVKKENTALLTQKGKKIKPWPSPALPRWVPACPGETCPAPPRGDPALAGGRGSCLQISSWKKKKNPTETTKKTNPQHDVIGFLVYPAGAPPPAAGRCLAVSLSTTTSLGTMVSLGTAPRLGTVLGDQTPALPAAPRLSQAPDAVNASFTSSSPLPQKASPCQLPSSHQLPGKKIRARTGS